MEEKLCDKALGVYYYSDDLVYYQAYTCGICDCIKFIQDNTGEDYEYADEIGSLTNWYNYENDSFIDLECHCGDSNYVLVKNRESDLNGWVCVEESYQTWKSCPNCGNEEDLERIIIKGSKDEDKMSMHCPKCKSVNIFKGL